MGSNNNIFSDPVTLISSPSVLIDGGAEFTNSKNIMLQLSARGAEEMLVSNTPNCESVVGWEKFSEAKAWVLSEENKSAHVYVKYRKKGAPETDCLSDEIIHDNVAPEILAQSLPASFTNQLAAQAKYSVLENGSGIKDLLCKDQLNQIEKCSEIYDFKGLDKEGTFSVVVTASDKAGNISLPLTATLVVDRTAPVVTINGPKGAQALSQANFKLMVADSNGLKLVQCRLLPLEPNFKDCKELVANYSNLVSGLYTFEAKAEDEAGNLGGAQQAFEVDLSVPTVTLTKVPDAIGSNRNVSFEFRGVSGIKPISQFKCSLDGAAFTACVSPLNLINLADKNLSFRVIGTNDVAVDSAPAEHKFIVDTVPPELRIVTSPSGTIKLNSATITLSATDLNGIKSLECSLNGSAYSDCSSRVANFAALADGAYSFVARAVDNAGNVSNAGPSTWTVDTTPDSQILASLSTDPTAEGLQTWLQVQSAQVKNLSYSCLGQFSKKEIAKGTSNLNSFNSPVLVNEDFSCEVKGLDKVNLEIKRVVNGQVNCGNRIKDQGRCLDFVCTKFTQLGRLPSGSVLNIAARAAGECYTYKLFDSIKSSSSKLTTVSDTEVISRNHDGSGPRNHNPYVLGRSLINFKLAGPRVVKLTGGANSLAPILVDNFVLSGIYPAQIAPVPSHYSAHGTKDSTVDANESHILLKNAQIPLKSFGPAGTATVAPLEIVREADTNLDYLLDVRALDCGGVRELSEVYLVFQ